MFDLIEDRSALDKIVTVVQRQFVDRVQTNCGVGPCQVAKTLTPSPVQMAASRCSSLPSLSERKEKAEYQSIAYGTSSDVTLRRDLRDNTIRQDRIDNKSQFHFLRLISNSLLNWPSCHHNLPARKFVTSTLRSVLNDYRAAHHHVVSLSAARCLILRRSDFGCCLLSRPDFPRRGECGSHLGRRNRDAKGHAASDDRLQKWQYPKSRILALPMRSV
jgi:hypothetical protein